MINEPRRAATEAQQNDEPQPEVRVRPAVGGTVFQEPAPGEVAFDAHDRAACLVTIYTYLLHRRARRLAAQTSNSGGASSDADRAVPTIDEPQPLDHAA